MAEDFVPEGVESEKADSRRLSSDLATGYALHEARKTLQGREAAAAFLASQKTLVDRQIIHVDDEYRNSHRAARLKRVSDVLRIVAQAAFIAVGLCVAVGVVAMWWTAFTSRAVVVSAFESPASLADRGLTGTVMAGKVLDGLLKIQDSTRFTAAQLQVEDAWSSAIEVNLPDSGISLAQISNALHRTFGHDIHIYGALTKTADGAFMLTVRGDGIPPTSFTGGESDIDNLARMASEYAFGYAQPTLYASYLIAGGRSADGVSFIREAYPRAAESDRLLLANLWGEALLALNRIPEADDRFRFALNLDRHYWRAWNNLIGVLPSTEGEEAAYASGLEMEKAAAPLPPWRRPTPYDLTNFSQLTFDPAAVIAGLTADRQLAQSEGAEYDASSWIAEQEAVRHDWQASAAYLAESPQSDPTTTFDAGNLGGLRAMETGDTAKAIEMYEAANRQWRTSPQLQGFFPDFQCNLGNAYAAAGRIADAMPLLQDRRFVRCRAFLADALDRSGPWEAAQQSYRDAEAAAPHMSFAYYREGLARLSRGDITGAMQPLERAHSLSPNWADPLKAIGDAFSAQKKWGDAVKAYDQAQALAPAWSDLHDASTKAAATARG